MHDFPIPICFFPSTVVMVEEKGDYLLNLILQLDETLAYRVFDSSFQSFQFIKQNRCDVRELQATYGQDISRLNEYFFPFAPESQPLSLVQAELCNPHRFSELSVLVVDNDLSFSDGINYFQHVENHAIKKFLLVERSDEKYAEMALQDGIIDKFVIKDNPNSIDLIKQGIFELQMKYFQEMSDIILDRLSMNKPKLLEDSTFGRFFWDIYQKKEIVEFYLIDNEGNFLMLNEDGHRGFFCVDHKKKNPYDWISAYEHTGRSYEEKTYQARGIYSYREYLDDLDIEELYFNTIASVSKGHFLG